MRISTKLGNIYQICLVNIKKMKCTSTITLCIHIEIQFGKHTNRNVEE